MMAIEHALLICVMPMYKTLPCSVKSQCMYILESQTDFTTYRSFKWTELMMFLSLNVKGIASF